MTDPTLTIDELKERAAVLASTAEALLHQIWHRENARVKAEAVQEMLLRGARDHGGVRKLVDVQVDEHASTDGAPLLRRHLGDVLSNIADTIDWDGLLKAERDRLLRIADGYDAVDPATCMHCGELNSHPTQLCDRCRPLYDTGSGALGPLARYFGTP